MRLASTCLFLSIPLAPAHANEEFPLVPSDLALGNQFGTSVAIQGTEPWSALLDDDGGFASGSAYVFERQDALLVEAGKLTASDAGVQGQFGTAVDLDGDTIVVGEPRVTRHRVRWGRGQFRSHHRHRAPHEFL